MKKHQLLLSAISFFFFSIFLFLSCQKELTKAPNQKALIQSAQNWYQQNKSTGSEQENFLTPLWNESEVLTSLQGEELVIVPLESNIKINNPKYDINTVYIFSEQNDVIKSGNIVQVIGESDYIKKNGKQLLANFKGQTFDGFEDGAIILYDIDNFYLESLTIKNGRALSSKSGISSDKPSTEDKNSSGSKRIASTRTTSSEGNCIDWYWITYNSVTGQIYSSTYLYSTCSSTGGGGNPGGTNTATTSTTPPPCSSSFHFVTYIPGTGDIQYEGGWQVAAIEDLHLNILMLTYVPGQPSVRIELPRMYFGLPVRRYDGTIYTYEYAQSIATGAVREAERKVRAAHKLGNTTQAKLKQVYIDTLQSYFASYKGTVTTYPGTRINVLLKDVSGADYSCP